MNDTATATARMLEGNLRAFAAHVSAPDDVLDAPRMTELYAYAAECVKRVPELEAEVERLRAIVRDFTLSPIEHQDPRIEWVTMQIERDLLAAATREGADG